MKVVELKAYGGVSPITEVRELQRLPPHPNVVRLFDQQKNEKFLVMVLEYCEGGDLDKVLLRGPLPENICRHLFRQLVEGLKHLQANGMMHRDLKPANLLLTSTDLEARPC